MTTLELKIEKVEKAEAKWFGLTENHYILTTPGKHFPKNKIAIVVNHRYVDSYKIGLVISGNLGTSSVAVLNVKKAKQLLGLPC